jgi:hypothetical protein
MDNRWKASDDWYHSKEINEIWYYCHPKRHDLIDKLLGFLLPWLQEVEEIKHTSSHQKNEDVKKKTRRIHWRWLRFDRVIILPCHLPLEIISSASLTYISFFMNEIVSLIKPISSQTILLADKKCLQKRRNHYQLATKH